MRRIALVFVVAVFAPSLVLGWLALRTAGEQRGILERQSATIHQHDTDEVAANIRDRMLARQREFAAEVRAQLRGRSAQALAGVFAREFSPPGTVAFAVAPSGVLVGSAESGTEFARFKRDNEFFLNSRAQTEVFPTQQSVLPNSFGGAAAHQTANAAAPLARNVQRQVAPQRNAGPAEAAANVSRIVPQISDFQTITSGDSDGLLARFNRNALEVILWTRPPEADGYRFGLALSAAAVRALVVAAFAELAPGNREICLAVLDENARPVATSVPGFAADWKRPFVASEIGEVLPHWEVALYLRDPERIERSARLVTLTLTLSIALALAAILGGGIFVALDARRQTMLARQKTDFVSNVSHELKTPLTSIRMFAELLEQDREKDPEKRRRYLEIIRAESERLTRLINDVLDFARREKRRQPVRKSVVDLHPVIADRWETCVERLREAGFRCEWERGPGPYWARADADAIGQVLTNLLDNAEKFSADRREITLRSEVTTGEVKIAVLDRGTGVPPGEDAQIFEPFHRSHDSLASGIPGTGLGLTLARGIAREHGGDLTFQRREGGGSVFTLRVPDHQPETSA